MKKLSLIVGALVIVLVIALLTHSSKNNEYVVRIGYAPNIGFLPLHIADQQGLFTKAGVRVELKQLQSGQQLYEALVRKELDYVPFLSMVPVMNGELVSPGNVKLVTVTDISLENQFDDILVKGNSTIKKLSDLKGKKIGVFPGTTGTNFLKKYFEEKGIDFSKIEFVQLPPPSQLQALESGSIDALHAYEPSLTIGVEKSGFRKLAGESIFASLINHSAIGGYWFSTNFAEKHPDLAQKIVSAMDAGNEVIVGNPTLARSVAKMTYNLDQTIADRVTLIKMVPSTQFKPEMLTSFVDYLVSIGELKSKPDLSHIYYR